MKTKKFTTSAGFGYGLTLSVASLLLMVGIFLYPNQVGAANIDSQKIIELTNQKRAEKGLQPLTANQDLAQAAQKKAEFLLEKQIFKHNTEEKKFSEWIQETEYEYSYIGENLAIDFTDNQDIIQAWMNSPSHKKNLLYPEYQEVGVAKVSGEYKGNNSILVVQIFGAPALQPSVSSSDKNTSLNSSQEMNKTGQLSQKNSDSTFLKTGVKAPFFKNNFSEKNFPGWGGIAAFSLSILFLVVLIYLPPAHQNTKKPNS